MNKKLRIAIFADYPIGENGREKSHAATWLPQLADAFEGYDDEFFWITFDKNTKTQTRFSRNNQTFIRLPEQNISINLLTHNYLARAKFLPIIESISPDMIHVWGTERLYTGALGIGNIPCILSMQGIISEYARIGSLPDMWQWKKIANLERKWIKKANVVTCESRWGLDRIAQIDPHTPTRMIEYGVHPSFYDVEWKPDFSDPYFVFCGGLDWRKGVDVLIDAFANHSKPNWKCKLIGEGVLENEVKALNHPNLILLGNLSRDQLQKELKNALFLVLPTRADTSPNVVKEARVVGLPVITTNHGGQAGYVNDDENGIIVDPLNSKNLSSAIDRLINNQKLVTSLGSTHHERDRNYFQVNNTVSSFISLYRSIVNMS